MICMPVLCPQSYDQLSYPVWYRTVYRYEYRRLYIDYAAFIIYFTSCFYYVPVQFVPGILCVVRSTRMEYYTVPTTLWGQSIYNMICSYCFTSNRMSGHLWYGKSGRLGRTRKYRGGKMKWLLFGEAIRAYISIPAGASSIITHAAFWILSGHTTVLRQHKV